MKMSVQALWCGRILESIYFFETLQLVARVSSPAMVELTAPSKTAGGECECVQQIIESNMCENACQTAQSYPAIFFFGELEE